MSTFPAGAENFQWRVASTCESGACVGVARQGEFIFIGNTNDPDAPASRFTPLEWKAFIAGVKLGDFDDITE
jgi:hypothetical protein